MNKIIILKFSDKYIYFYKKEINKLIIEPLEEQVIANGKIINVEKFLSILEEKINKNKLSNILIKTKIYILIPSFYNKTDYFLLNYLFKSLNYYNYKFIEEKTIYKNLLEKNTAIINLWDDTGEISYLEEDKIISIPYTQNTAMNIKKKNIIIINNTSYHKVNIKDKNIYYIEPKKYYLIEELKKEL